MTKRLIKPDTSQLDDSVNPLTVSDFKIYINRADIWKKLKDGKGGQIETSFEASRITKIMVKSSNRLLLWNECSMRARDLWHWIYHQLIPAQDYIWINYTEYMNESGCTSINTYKDALGDLVKSGLLAMSQVKGVYWINPRYCFQGSRINKYPDKVVILKSKKKEDEGE